MSRRENCYDNAMAENFFSILKAECIYRHKPKTFREANDRIDSFIHFYNHERIQLKTGVAPLSLRHSRCVTPLNSNFLLRGLFFSLSSFPGAVHTHKRPFSIY